jgi:enamine deaminase RidA (YjgF/YER057c/UK114 family)
MEPRYKVFHRQWLQNVSNLCATAILTNSRVVKEECLQRDIAVSDEIKSQLSEANKSFYWFKFSALKETDKPITALIQRASDKLLQQMDDITELYAKIGSKKDEGKK